MESTAKHDRSITSSVVCAVVNRFAVPYQLSVREATVLALAALGLRRKESAFCLHCSAATVDTYWRRIFRKTQRASQAELFAALLLFGIADCAERELPTAQDEAFVQAIRVAIEGGGMPWEDGDAGFAVVRQTRLA